MIAISRLFKCSCDCTKEDPKQFEPASFVNERVSKQMSVLKDCSEILNGRFGWGRRSAASAQTQLSLTGNLKSFSCAEKQHGAVDQGRPDGDVD